METWWQKVMTILLFALRVPIAILALASVALVSGTVFLILWRSAEWLWSHWLSRPW
jgi:hypothetical protein